MSDEEPLDAYSRIVTEVAAELLPHVASVRVRGSPGRRRRLSGRVH